MEQHSSDKTDEDESDEVRPFERHREDYLFKYEGLTVILITLGLLIGAHMGLLSIWWLFGFIALHIFPPEVNKVRKHGLQTYLNAIHFKKPSIIDITAIIAGLISIFAIFTSISYTYISIIADSGSSEALNQGGHLISEASINIWILIGAIIFMFLVVGPLEEYFFRHKLQKFLESKLETVGKSILVTNILFSLIHIPILITVGSLIAYIIPLTLLLILGIVFSIQYEYTDNLAVPSLTHSIYNSIVLLFLFIG